MLNTPYDVDLTRSNMEPYLHSVGELSCEKGDFTILNVTRKRYCILKVKDAYCVTECTICILASSSDRSPPIIFKSTWL
jgi:hypothetical protein